MTIWRREHGRDCASAHAFAILKAIETDIGGGPNTFPQVASIRIGASRLDSHDFEVEMAIAPGVAVAVLYQSVNEEGRDPDDLESEGGSVAFNAVYAAKSLQAYAPALTERFYVLRVRTRKMLAGWQADGAQAQLIDIRLIWTEHNFEGDEPRMELRIRCLDGSLRPMVERLDLFNAGDLETVLAGLRSHVEGRFKMRAALARQGATGLIDQIALNAISQYAEVAAILRTLASRSGSFFLGDTIIFRTTGVVQCDGYDRYTPKLSWNRHSITIHGQSLPDTTLAASIGRPITDLVEHPILSQDMIIWRAYEAFDPGPAILAELIMPQRLYCGVSGRTWECDGMQP
jgi:hypothetical protein